MKKKKMIVEISGRGYSKPIKFKKGALSVQLGVKEGDKIPSKKMQAALAGKKGRLAKKRAEFAKNVLGIGRKTAATNRKKKKK